MFLDLIFVMLAFQELLVCSDFGNVSNLFSFILRGENSNFACCTLVLFRAFVDDSPNKSVYFRKLTRVQETSYLHNFSMWENEILCTTNMYFGSVPYLILLSGLENY